MSETWKKLQNGSDIRGVALEGVAGEPVNLTTDKTQTIAKAFAAWLADKKGQTAERLQVAVGRDSRLSGKALQAAVATGLSEAGITVIDVGLASTPAMFMSTVLPGHAYDGSIMLTASHLPFNRNGLKFFTAEGGLEKKDITEILDLAANDRFEPAATPGVVTAVDFIPVYARYLVTKIREGANDPVNDDQPLKGLRILVDAGNGAGGFFAAQVLEPLGADTTGSQFLEPDGSFPNHIPNPEDAKAMASIQAAVLANQADLGIIFDTDVDRAGAVDRNGKEINRNRIIALMAAIVLGEHPCSTIVTDSITSDELQHFIEKRLGGKHHRFKRGYKNVINEAIRLNSLGQETHLAIETSGHGALKENYFLDDGAYLIAKILIQVARLKREGKTVDSLLADLAEPAEAKEFRLNILKDDFRTCGLRIIENLTAAAEQEPGWQAAAENYEGIRIAVDQTHGDGWFLLRLSLHDPLMPLNIESRQAGGVHQIATRVHALLSGIGGLDLSAIEKFL
jgi:phosphomannomutase